MNTINYAAIAKAQAMYAALGFQPVEVPWRVSNGIIAVTRPAGVKADYLIQGTGKGLIASGEQGFMSLMNKGILPPGKYQTVTPCFRNEDYDDTHSKQFMKLELIEIFETPSPDCDVMNYLVDRMVQEVLKVFTQLGYSMEQLRIHQQQPDDPLLVSKAHDIEANVNGRWIELGSYGTRRAHFGTWVYGTGIAEPRFSKTLAALHQQ